MTERPSQPSFQLVPPPIEVAPPPDYSQATIGQLRAAEAINLTRLLTADVSHFILQGAVFARQLYGFLMGEEEDVEWDPDVQGLRPDLDEKQRFATEQLEAIWQEKALRRAKRQELSGSLLQSPPANTLRRSS